MLSWLIVLSLFSDFILPVYIPNCKIKGWPFPNIFPILALFPKKIAGTPGESGAPAIIICF